MGGGSNISDFDVYKIWKGGLAYTEEKLRELFDTFEVIEIRPMLEKSKKEKVFGKEIVWACLFKGV